MDKYKRYMDSVEASDEFQEKLKGLNAPKKPMVWQKYGAMAAALVLVVGLGALGFSRFLPQTELGGPEQERIHTDIAVFPVPSDGLADHVQNGGGYEVTDGEVAAYFMLPYIEYQDETAGMAADYSLAPPGARSRDAAREDVILMVGHPDHLATHLGWDDSLEWGGVIWFEESGDPCAASIYAVGQDVYFFIEMMEGGEIPDCIVLPEDSCKTTEFAGVEIRGLKNCGYRIDDSGVEMRESRKVSFFADGMGYKLTIYGVDANKVDELAARFARWAIVEGFDLSAAIMDGAEPVDPDVGEPNYEDGVSTPAYDPNAD